MTKISIEAEYELLSVLNELKGAQKDFIDELKSPHFSPKLMKQRERFIKLWKEYWNMKRELSSSNTQVPQLHS